MEEEIKKVTCMRCGKEIWDYFAPLKTVVALNKTRPENLIDTLCKETGVPTEVAKDYIEHQYLYTRCEISCPPCPKCGHELKTWRAKLCLKCDWRREPNEKLQSNNNT